MDKANHKTYENELFKRLANSPALREHESVFSQYFKKPIWWMVQKLDKPLPITIKDVELHCSEYCAQEKKKEKCLGELYEALNKSKRSKKAEIFSCSLGLGGFSYPVVQGKKIYGYIVMCHAEKDIPQFIIDMFIRFVDTLVREIQKELELSKLYEAIRPRAIALSTVHTIHRLLTSTLELEELLPRIARLSLQVVRSNRCSIKLVDKKKRVLLPKTTVDLRKKSVKLKKVKVGMYAPGKAFKMGKVIMGRDYMAVPLIDTDVIGVITLYDKVDGTPFGAFDKEIMSTLGEQAVIAITNAMLYREQKRMTEGAIKSLTSILDIQGPGMHKPRAPFIKIALETGKIFRLSQEELKSLEYAYLLHDAGKAILPESILVKSSKLTRNEYRLIRELPIKGADIIRPLKTLRASVPMILHQRERFDGKGYPDKLKGNRIPLGARIISATSAFEAMLLKRSYQTRRSIPRAIAEIKRNSGTQFDPKVVDAFLKILSRRHIKSILRKAGYEI